MDLKIVSRYIGIAILFNALLMCISVLVSIVCSIDESFYPLLISTAITASAGGILLIFADKHKDINLKEGYAIITLSWIFSCLFGMLPYIMYGGEFTISNALFESVSGYTTTGSTILKYIENIPKGLLFWRSSTHWLGGLGVILFMLLILPTVSTYRLKLSKIEISSLSKENFRFKTNNTIRIIMCVYLGLTFLCTSSFMLAGMNFFDAVNHGFSVAATGGFSTRDTSFMAFDSVWIEIVAMLFMVLAGMHFGLIYSVFTGKISDLLRSRIVRFYLLSLIVAGLLVSLNIKFSGVFSEWGTAFRKGFFQVISIGTTTGFATADSSIWPAFAILVLIYLSFQCSCSGSTSGGIKVDRIYIFLVSLKTQLAKILHPNAVILVKVNKHPIEKDIAYSVALYIVIYVILVFLVAALLSLMGLNLIDSFTSSAASMSNVGPGFGSVGSLSNYGHFPVAAKLLLSFQMLLGRLEIYPLLLIFIFFREQ